MYGQPSSMKVTTLLHSLCKQSFPDSGLQTGRLLVDSAPQGIIYFNNFIGAASNMADDEQEQREPCIPNAHLLKTLNDITCHYNAYGFQ